MRREITAGVLAALLSAGWAAADEDVFHLPIGDPERRDRTVELGLDVLTDAASGEHFQPAELAARLAGVRLLFVGESHTSMEFHRVQLRVLEELHRAGREVFIGLEMFPYTHQVYLDQWVEGLLTPEGLLRLSEWYETWTYHWDYYRRIFHFARDNGLPMFAINTPREVVRAVREKGFENLTEEEEAHVPAVIDTDSDEHRRLFRAFFDSDDPLHAMLSEEQWEGMFNAQCTWDATMAHHAVQALEERGGPESVMVVLIGSGHVAYGLGIQRQAAHSFDGRMASLIPVTIRDDEDELVETVQASYADFLWGLPPERDPLHPMLGLSTTEVDGEPYRKVIYISEDTPAESAGFELGDILLSFDGTALDEKGTLSRLLSELMWGDSASLRVRRGEEELDLSVHFRRNPDNY